MGKAMTNERLAAFSDGVIAIIITIMVLEMKTPEGTSLRDLLAIVPVLLSYLLSFVYVGIYWNNHHHLIAACRHVSGTILWANLHLLFWMSLIPFATGWMDETQSSSLPMAVYGCVLMMSGVGYYVLQLAIVKRNGPLGALERELGNDWKARGSIGIYAAAIPLAAWAPRVSLMLYIGVAAMWLVPDRRIERALEEDDREKHS